MYFFKFFNSLVEGGKLYVQLIDLRLIIGSGYSPNPLRSHFVPQVCLSRERECRLWRELEQSSSDFERSWGFAVFSQSELFAEDARSGRDEDRPRRLAGLGSAADQSP